MLELQRLSCRPSAHCASFVLNEAPYDLHRVTEHFRIPCLFLWQQLLPNCVSTRVHWVHRGCAPRLLRRAIQYRYGLLSVPHIGHQRRRCCYRRCPFSRMALLNPSLHTP